ncbi:DUF6397 family protein [Actinacidiphila paucisporea]|uniref:Uncharacterized protein n=1 Tax=Actinacidiphila paucisporea TaxID=310782 RepID=A0A1M7AW16_9ACTN|nr:DUF6397 family protein [Actinacidiphila paucisporea]SHL46922.1 hypothetical protein SAMN05216499_104209 [Actinacidiphila paucisporea]
MTTKVRTTGKATAAGGTGRASGTRRAGAAGDTGRAGRVVARGQDPGGPPTLTLDRACEELSLGYPDFELALVLGEIATVGGGTGRLRVPAQEIARVREAEGGARALLARIQLVNTTDGAELLGISRDRLLRLTRAGCVRPVRWYVNRYRALVWLYLASELRDFAAASPALLSGRLPAAVRESADDGEDQRPRGWRSRRVAQLVRDAPGPWEEAAVWAALLGPEMTLSAVPDPYERARLQRIHPALPPGRPGPLADAALIGRLTTADHPDEIALGLVALADALGRARDRDPVPRHQSLSQPELRPPGAVRAELPAVSEAPAVPDAPPAPVAGAVVPVRAPLPAPAPWPVEDRPRRSLRRLLRGRRQVTDG